MGTKSSLCLPRWDKLFDKVIGENMLSVDSYDGNIDIKEMSGSGEIEIIDDLSIIVQSVLLTLSNMNVSSKEEAMLKYGTMARFLVNDIEDSLTLLG